MRGLRGLLAQEARKAVEVVCAIYQSAKEGRPVQINTLQVR